MVPRGLRAGVWTGGGRWVAIATTLGALLAGAVGAWSMVEARPQPFRAPGSAVAAESEEEREAPERRCDALGQERARRILGGRFSQEPKLAISTTSGSVSCLFRSAETGKLDEIMVTYVADVRLRDFMNLAKEGPPDARIEPLDSLGRAAYWEAPIDGRPYGILSVYFGGRALVVQIGIARLTPPKVRNEAVYLARPLVEHLASKTGNSPGAAQHHVR